MKKGMNPEAVQQMAQQIEDSGQNIQELYGQANSRVNEFDWTGEDRDRYVQDFDSVIGQLVQQILQQTSDFAERARQNAQQQIDASS